MTHSYDPRKGMEPRMAAPSSMPRTAYATHPEAGQISDQPTARGAVRNAQTVRFEPHPTHGGNGYGSGSAAHVYGGAETGGDDNRPRLGATQWGGALVSLALVVGLGVWGYKLMVRDVSGVPVIRALAGEARLVPEDPGGQLAMHQGLAVNSVTADGSASPPADRLILAPHSAALSDEDKALSEIEPVLSAVEASDTVNESDVDASLLVEASVDAEGIALEDFTPVSADIPLTTASFGVVNSPRPLPRPAKRVMAPTNGVPSLDGVAGDVMAALTGTAELSGADLEAGARLVQFGAFQDVEVARSEWEKLAGRFSDFMDGKTRVIEEATSGGKTFYRLRASGFADAADADRFCAALTSMNAPCVPTVHR
ncbi:SPOR domain-containing protein [Celeribacter arenosi]